MGFNLFDLLLPREGKFYRFLEDQTKLLVQQTQVLKDLLAHLETSSEDEIKKQVWLIHDLEKQGDQVESQILEALNSTFITPFDREDIMALSSRLDNAMDSINGAAKKIILYHYKKAPSKVCRFGEILVSATQELPELFKLFEKKQSPYGVIEKIHHFEVQADDLFYEAVAELFGKEDNAIKLMKLKELYEILEESVDSVDLIAKTLRSIMVKQG